MRKNFILLAVIAALLTAVSCKKATRDDSATYFNFVTVVNDDKDGNQYHFVTDDGARFNPTLNKTRYKGQDGRRVVIYFGFEQDPGDTTPKESDIKLFEVDTLVIIGHSSRIATNKNNELAAFGSDPLSVNVAPYGPLVTKKYLNVYIGYNPEKPMNHEFSLVSIADEDNDRNRMTANICHDSKKDQGLMEIWSWVSFPLDEMTEALAGRKKIMLRTVSRFAGAQDVDEVTLP